MNKATRILLALGLILAVAAPAFADFHLNGYFRSIGYNQEKKNTSHDYGDSQQFIDQRLRMRANWTLNDNVGVIYFAEVDTTWGENNKASLNQGGQSGSFAGGADGVNVETKQAFLDLKFGDTAAQVGIIGAADAFESIIYNDDMAGVQVTHKMGDTNFKLVYSKWDEDDGENAATVSTTTTTTLTGAGAPANPSGATSTSTSTFTASSAFSDNTVRGYWDDFDFYAAEVGHKFNDSFKAGAGVYFMDNNTADGTTSSTNYDKEIFFYGLNGEAKLGANFAVNGFVVVQDGEIDYKSGSDSDISALAASVKGTMKLDNGDIGLRVIYFSEDDDDKDQGNWQGFKGQYAFVKENQMQFLTDPYVMNDGKERYAEVDAAEAGFGLLAFVLSGNHKLPEGITLGWGAGYYMAIDDEKNDPSPLTAANYSSNIGNYRDGKTLGYEVCARIGKKFFEKVDVSLNASYAGYGSFYDKSVGTKSVIEDGELVDVTGDDPDATYKTYLMVNVPF